MDTSLTKNITTENIRTAFLNYFASKQHQIVSSSPLIPANDPTLLFTNAGMVQFKDVFLGHESRKYTRAVTSQLCVRAGGKHNDLENVGYTARHHTFFEMLGNFSFGDYFKHDAIHFAWDFLTNILKLPEEKLWVTVFEDDDEAADIWLKEVRVSAQRFSRIGAKDNFWSMGDTGPCGPCSEIFYDHGEAIAGGPPGTADEDGDRYIEIWNLVFMQYDRDKQGNLNPLPKPSVDTGMGLERLAAVLQQVHNNYDIDLFQALIKAAADLTHCTDLSHKSLRVIADHIRACSFLIADGIVPSNEGRGSVLRRIIRRALRHGHQLGMKENFFYKLVDAMAQIMGNAYPQLIKQKEHITKVLLQEEQKFSETLDQGMSILENEFKHLKGKLVSGDTVFKLYDTFGFPVDLTADIARERKLEIDMEGFEKAMQVQKERARSAANFSVDYSQQLIFNSGAAPKTDFTGYDSLNDESTILDIFVDSKAVQKINEKQAAVLIMNHTPFYAESGGQVGDKGLIVANDAEFIISDTQKQGDTFLHYGQLLKGEIVAGQQVKSQVDVKKRSNTAANHSATHLLHAALRHVLGEHVQQKGSLVDDTKLRFDFSHFEPINDKQIKQIEMLVNEQIRFNHQVETRLMNIDDARSSGAMALFGEKYADEVRVLSMSDFSVELCGGTHVSRTGNIGLFKIIAETGIAAGIRRIEAVSGESAINYLMEKESLIQNLAQLLKAPKDKLQDKIASLVEQNKNLEKENEQLKGRLASKQGDDLIDKAIEIQGVKVLAIKIDDLDPKSMRESMDKIKSKLGNCIVVIGTAAADKVNLVAGVSKDNVNKIKAGELVNFVAEQVGGKGGGRPDMAMAGGSQPENLDKAIASVYSWLEEKLK